MGVAKIAGLGLGHGLGLDNAILYKVELLTFVKKLVREHQLSQICHSHRLLKNIHCPKELLRILEEIGLAA
jgi:hypothetical protein